MNKVIFQKVIYESPSVNCYKVAMPHVICGSVDPNPTATGENFNYPEYE